MNYTVTEDTPVREIIEAAQNADTSELLLTYQDGAYLKKFPHHIAIIKRIFAHMGKEILVQVVGSDGQPPVPAVEHNASQTLVTDVVHTESPLIDKKPISRVAPVEFSPVVESALSTQATVQSKTVPINVPIKRRTFGINPKRLLIVIFVLVVLGLAAGGAFAYYYLPRGTVVLFVAEKTFERKLEVTVKTTVSAVNPEENVIPGTPITVEIEATENFDATGRKTIGEKAAGEIKVKNFTTTAIRLSSGDVITSQSDSTKQFMLTEGVTVPKATITQPTEDTKVLDAGVISITVSAVDIGSEFNLSASTRFVLEGYEVSDVYAVNDIPFSGGLTKEVTVVSANDQSQAMEQLRSKLVADVPGALDAKLSDTQKYQVESINHATQFAQFSHEVGEEVDSFSLSMKLASTVISYDHTDVTALMQTLIVDAVPDGFELSSDNDPVGVDKVESIDDETLQLSTRILALVVPILDTYKIKQELLGVKPADAELILQNIKEIDGYEVRLWPTLPDVLKSFPHIEEKLEVLVEISK